MAYGRKPLRGAFNRPMMGRNPRSAARNRVGAGNRPRFGNRPGLFNRFRSGINRLNPFRGRRPGSGGSRRMGTPTIGNVLTGRGNRKRSGRGY